MHGALRVSVSCTLQLITRRFRGGIVGGRIDLDLGDLIAAAAQRPDGADLMHVQLRWRRAWRLRTLLGTKYTHWPNSRARSTASVNRPIPDPASSARRSMSGVDSSAPPHGAGEPAEPSMSDFDAYIHSDLCEGGPAPSGDGAFPGAMGFMPPPFSLTPVSYTHLTLPTKA